MSSTFTDANGQQHATRHFDLQGQRQPLPSLVRTAQDLDRWRDEREAGEAQVKDLVAERRRILTSASVEMLRALDDRLATARVRAERAAAVVVDAEETFARLAAERAAGEPARRAAYVEACNARDEYEHLHRKIYAPAARKIAEALARMAELAAQIERANRDRPDDAERIDAEAFREIRGGGGYDHRLTTRVNLPGVGGGDSPFWRGQS